MHFADSVADVLRDYPRIFFACHRRHVRDPQSGAMVSEKQAQVLDHLDEVTPMSMTALASHAGVTLGTMSVAIDRLAKRGYVRRTPDATDRRRVLLRLTEAGARICEAHSVLDPQLVDRMIAAIPEADRARALEGLALLAQAASRSAHHAKSVDRSA